VVTNQSATITFVNMDTSEQMDTVAVDLEEPGFDYVPDLPMWGAHPNAITADGEVFMLTSDDDVSITPISTPPQASRSGPTHPT